MPILRFLRRVEPEKFERKKLKHTHYNSTSEQEKILRRYGNHLWALMHEMEKPATEGEKHFIEMCKGNVEPNNEIEIAWKSYLSTIEEDEALHAEWLEQKRQIAAAKHPLESLYVGEESRVLGSAPVDESTTQPNSGTDDLVKCPACGGTVYDCWRCSGRGWIEAH
jgi:uncharacterized protein YifE (UPF0438 family)